MLITKLLANRGHKRGGRAKAKLTIFISYLNHCMFYLNYFGFTPLTNPSIMFLKSFIKKIYAEHNLG